jgi:hypothetical protein
MGTRILARKPVVGKRSLSPEGAYSFRTVDNIKRDSNFDNLLPQRAKGFGVWGCVVFVKINEYISATNAASTKGVRKC